MLPTLFVSHGAPTLPLNEAAEVHHFLRGLLDGIGPRAILMVSAHWEDDVAALTGASPLATIHDFSGFPQRLYDLRYDPPGDPTLAAQASSMLVKAGIESRVDPQRGIDHGGWTPLIISAPGADIPVVQLSLVRGLDARRHNEIGRALKPLRDDGVLIIGSGGAVHNLRALDWAAVDSPGKAATPPGWAADFQKWLDQTLATPDRSQALIEWQKVSGARMAHPREEHLLPLHVVAAAAEGEAATKLHQSWEMGSLSLAAWRFGNA